MGGGAWPFLVGGVICLVNSDNERDLSEGGWGGPGIPGPQLSYPDYWFSIQWKLEAITGL